MPRKNRGRIRHSIWLNDEERATFAGLGKRYTIKSLSGQAQCAQRIIKKLLREDDEKRLGGRTDDSES